MRQRCARGKRKATCSKCGKEKEISRAKQRYCKSCHAAQMRATRKKRKIILDINPTQ